MPPSAPNALPTPDTAGLHIEGQVNLQPYNTFGLPALAATLVRLHDEADVTAVLNHASLRHLPKVVLGGGSNIVITRDLDLCVLKVEIKGRRLLQQRDDAWLLEFGAGEAWHDAVAWSLEQGCPGLENLALIPGSVGASPVQNIGAYGLELAQRFDSCDGVDLQTGQAFTLNAEQCRFGYRDSIFKQGGADGLAGRALITRVRLALPRPWRPSLGYLDLQRKMEETGITAPDARQIFDWVCAIRRAKLPDPAVVGNAGSFFKNPVVSEEQCRDIIARDPHLVYYEMGDGSYKLAAGWLIDACGWKGKSVGAASVYDKQALVLINRGGARGAEVMTLARAIQESVYGRFGIRLEPEPVVWP